MSHGFNLLSEICLGRYDYKIRVRVLYKWKQPDYNNPSVIGSIGLVLIDEKGSKIQATIKDSLISKFESILEVGSAYVFENLVVAEADPKFKTTRHKYRLTFMKITKWRMIKGDDIPKPSLEFVSFPKILGGVDDGFLFDVIGHIVQRGILKETLRNNKKFKLLEIALEDLESNRIICTLWDNYAESMDAFLQQHQGDRAVVVIIRMCKINVWKGTVGISNSYNNCTEVLINANVAEVNDYRNKLERECVTPTQIVSQMSGQTVVSLGDDLMHTSYLNISDLMDVQEPCFITVLAKGIRFNLTKGWYFDSCKKCYLGVTTIGEKDYCERCADFVDAVPRFKLLLEVMDTSGSTTFMLFDRYLEPFLGKSAPELIQAMQQTNEVAAYPPDFDKLLNKEMIFKVEITAKDLRQNRRTYIVKRLTDDTELIKKFKTQHSIQDYGEEYEFDQLKCLSPRVADNIKTITDDGLRNELIEASKNIDTPSTKSGGKRPIEAVDVTSPFEDGATQSSSTKIPKVVIKKGNE